MDETTEYIFDIEDLSPENIDVRNWTPTLFQIKDPDTQNYVGNVIGNRSLEDQILVVTDAGALQKEAILEESQQLISEINESARNLLDIMAISSDTMKEIVLFFGGTFVLGTSVLDSTPLG